MPSKQQQRRERVVTFYLANDLPKTLAHFKAENMAKSTINNIISTYNKRQTTDRAVGSGIKKNKKTTDYHSMTPLRVNKLYSDFNHSDKFSIHSAARKYGVNRETIRYWLRKRQIKRYVKKKCPKYTESQKIMVKRQCAWMYRYFRSYDFVIDDEKYFTLSHSINNSYFASPSKSTPDSVKYRPKQKFEPKVLLWIAISKNGISKPFLIK